MGRIQFQTDLQALNKAFSDVLKDHPFDSLTNQISVTTRPGHSNNVYDGVGSLFDYDKKQFWAHERDFTEIADPFKNTSIASLAQIVKDRSPLPVGRIRFMRLKPKSCLSLHQDTDLRLHIAVKSNPQCFFVFQDQGPIHMPCDGSLYWTNTLKFHSVFNGHDTEERIHMVFSTYEGQPGQFQRFLARTQQPKPGQ